MQKLQQYLVLLCLGLCCNLVLGQKDYKGVVIDAQSKAVIPYVNIGIVSEGLGTVSDEKGLFHLSIKKESLLTRATLLFSALGYAPLEIPLNKIPLLNNEYPVFELTPQPMVLSEVVVSNKEGQFISDFVGYKNYGEQTYGYFKDQIALGGELATRINVKKGLRRLERLQFEVVQNLSDSLLLRVNIYDDDGVLGKPKTNLNTSAKNILVTVKKSDKVIWVNLKPFDVYVKNDFVVSLELLKVYGNQEFSLILTAAYNRYGSYRKYASQDNWELLSNQNMAYYLETSLMVSEAEAQVLKKRQAKKKKKMRTISGFTLRRGKKVVGVSVINTRTKEMVLTDQNGRYSIAANKKDKIHFKKEGYKTMLLTVDNRLTENVIMKPE